jgi:SAM-dependent methyltransferase
MRMKRRECNFHQYVLSDYSFVRFPPGARVLDLGCGDGLELAGLSSHGATAIGVDPYWPSLKECRRQQLRVAQARAEELPIRNLSLDGVLCKGVVPYTDEQRAFSEINRVLKSGAPAYCVYLGAGYYLRYFLYWHYWKYNFYGLRVLLNTWLFTLTGLKLPGFLGDTVYQTRRQVARYYKRNGLELVSDVPARTFLGFPVFIYQAVRKVAS